MNRPHRVWYLLIPVLALIPFGLRVFSWHLPESRPVDPEMAQAGLVLFDHEWEPGDPLAASGDGLGPVFNDSSCVACHHQGGPGGSGGLEHNVKVFTARSENPDTPPREGVIHARAVSAEFKESVSLVRRLFPSPQPVSDCGPRPPDRTHISQRNTPALFGAKLIDDIPDRVILAQERSEQARWGWAKAEDESKTVGRALRLPNGRVGHFGWKAQTASLSDFVQAACANELGLGNPGQAQPRPLAKPDYQPSGLDLTLEQCNQLTAFCASLARPVERMPADPAVCMAAQAGKMLFSTVGCAECHTPNLGSVEGVYSDLLLHRMGRDLVAGGSYNERPAPLPDFPSGDGPQPSEWRTPPLWGVADSAPYLHDGRAATLEDAIKLHGGQAQGSAKRYGNLNPLEREQLVAFLMTLRAP
jgi:CxxC motif-containing protein (DUF1111 family)